MIRFFLIVSLLVSGAALAEDFRSNEEATNQSIEKSLKPSQESQQSKCDNNKDGLAEMDIKKQLERSGCCSWHGGVCGCSSGRVVCCDGKLSPSCGC